MLVLLKELVELLYAFRELVRLRTDEEMQGGGLLFFVSNQFVCTSVTLSHRRLPGDRKDLSFQFLAVDAEYLHFVVSDSVSQQFCNVTDKRLDRGYLRAMIIELLIAHEYHA